jgi:hypothetical protein
MSGRNNPATLVTSRFVAHSLCCPTKCNLGHGTRVQFLLLNPRLFDDQDRGFAAVLKKQTNFNF